MTLNKNKTRHFIGSPSTLGRSIVLNDLKKKKKKKKKMKKRREE